jgi:4-hydroxy-tetrahydrodipicolinate reductase
VITLRVGVLGATGRVGKEVCRLIGEGYQSPGFSYRLVMKVSSREGDDDKSLKTLDQISGDEADVWIDFSVPVATLTLLNRVCVPIVVGTTGMTESDIAMIRDFSRKFPVLMAPNFSIGITLMRNMLSALKPTVPGRIFLSEEHHGSKKDAPSGTAKLLLEDLCKIGFSAGPVDCIRAGAIVGVHRLRWISDGEEIEIVHRAHDRSIFARGALLCAGKLTQAPPGIHTMEKILEDR